MVSLVNKKVIIIGDRDGMPAGSRTGAVRFAGGGCPVTINNQPERNLVLHEYTGNHSSDPGRAPGKCVRPV